MGQYFVVKDISQVSPKLHVTTLKAKYDSFLLKLSLNSGGLGCKKFFFLPFRPQFGLKIGSPLDPPLPLFKLPVVSKTTRLLMEGLIGKLNPNSTPSLPPPPPTFTCFALGRRLRNWSLLQAQSFLLHLRAHLGELSSGSVDKEKFYIIHIFLRHTLPNPCPF